MLLMDIPLEKRYPFLVRVMQDQPVAYRITYKGDPIRQRRLKRRLRHLHISYKIQEHRGEDWLQ
jgi:hypothetical protein